jgi:hypothetical protein
MSETDKYLDEMNRFFQKITGCDQIHIHNKRDCKYIGSVSERLEKYREIKNKNIICNIKESDKVVLKYMCVQNI